MKTIIWDFNGTILEDTDICIESENALLKKRGMNKVITKEEYLDIFEFPVINYYKKIGFDFEKESFNDISVDFITEYNARSNDFKLKDSFPEKIAESIEKGNRNIILSASKMENLLEQCEMLDIEEYFDDILGTDNIYAHSKVQIGLDWLHEAGVNKEDCLFVGDTLHDEEVADALGVPCILVCGGHQSKEKLLQGHSRVIDDLKEMEV